MVELNIVKSDDVYTVLVITRWVRVKRLNLMKIWLKWSYQ